MIFSFDSIFNFLLINRQNKNNNVCASKYIFKIYNNIKIMSFDQINSFKIDKLKRNRYLFTDIFIADNKINFISMIHADIQINFEKVEIYIVINEIPERI